MASEMVSNGYGYEGAPVQFGVFSGFYLMSSLWTIWRSRPGNIDENLDLIIALPWVDNPPDTSWTLSINV